MKDKLVLSLALLFALLSSARAQEFPIGIWFNGYQSGLDSVSAINFTWIQTYGGYDRTAFNNVILQNNRNLKVVAILEKNIYNPSIAQRMFYEAELTDSQNGIRNYFASHQMGPEVIRLGENVWQALVNSQAAGYMVQSPLPDDQYFYQRMHWVATANISIDPIGNSSAQVARIEIANGANILAQ